MPTPPPQPGILLPRTSRGQRLFDDENLDRLSHVLENCFRIPGTSIRFGIDGIIGLIPGLGDIITGLAACIIVIAAWFRGVPYVTLVRMIVNVAIDVIIGAIPFLGDVFDIAWKANRRNYKLLIRHLAEPRRHTWRDWCVLLLMALTIALILLAPIVVLAWLVAHFMHALGIH